MSESQNYADQDFSTVLAAVLKTLEKFYLVTDVSVPSLTYFMEGMWDYIAPSELRRNENSFQEMLNTGLSTTNLRQLYRNCVLHKVNPAYLSNLLHHTSIIVISNYHNDYQEEKTLHSLASIEKTVNVYNITLPPATAIAALHSPKTASRANYKILRSFTW